MQDDISMVLHQTPVPMHEGDDKRRGFARPSASHAHHIIALQYERHGLALDGGWQAVALATDGAQDQCGKAHRLCGVGVTGACIGNKRIPNVPGLCFFLAACLRWRPPVWAACSSQPNSSVASASSPEAVSSSSDSTSLRLRLLLSAMPVVVCVRLVRLGAARLDMRSGC